MKEIKLTVDGKEVRLTDEQLRMLRIEVENRKNPFERVVKGKMYYKITGYGNVDNFREDGDSTDQGLYEGVNYFNDESVAQQVALHQLLYRKLLKFGYDNECEDTAEWDNANEHWKITYCKHDDDFTVLKMKAIKDLSVYFSTEEGASRAINEVIRPFMKEHPDFVW